MAKHEKIELEAGDEAIIITNTKGQIIIAMQGDHEKLFKLLAFALNKSPELSMVFKDAMAFLTQKLNFKFN